MAKTPFLTSEMFKPKEIPEKVIQKQIRDVLAWKKCYVIRFNSGVFSKDGRFIRAYTLPNGKSDGLPDLGFIKDGQIHFIEVKRKGGKVRPGQAEFMRTIAQYGAKTLVADCWEQALDYVQKLEKTTRLSNN